MSQHQEPRTVSVDEIPVDPTNTVTGDIDSAEVPEGIRSITIELASPQPPTNPLVVLKVARWWYVHGRGTADPVFQWAIEWMRHLATDDPLEVQRYADFLDRLVETGFADDRRALRSKMD